jgi:hypothetical protein
MAHIFRADNQNKKELDDYINQHVEQQRRVHEVGKAKRPRQRFISVCVIIACIAVAAMLVFKEGLLSDIRWGAMDVLARWSDGLWVAGTGGKSIFHLAIQLVCKALSLVCLVLTWVAPLLVPVALFALLAVISFLAYGAYLNASGEFDEEKARADAEGKMDDELQRIKAGVVGEEAALNIVSALSDECYIFTNLVVKYDGEDNETDLIVVSPTGLTMVEVKNYSGLLMGDLSDREFIHRKYLKNGTYTDDTARNPVKQVGAPIYKLAHYLKDQGITITVRRCALFVNENVQFQLTDRAGLSKDCPLYLKDSPEFLTYLHRSGSRALRPGDINRIVEALKKQM